MERKMTCPAPEMSHKRSRMIVGIAAFYKRPIDRNDIIEINPEYGKQKGPVELVFKRLVRKGYLEEVVGDRFALTRYGYDQMIAYATWYRLTKGPVQ